MADVFISYKREDRALAEGVIAQVEAAGFSVWWDQRLTPQEAWDEWIKAEMDASKAVLVLWTPRAARSEWVRIEASYAMEADKLVPVKLEPCDLPLAFRLRQTADLTGRDGMARATEWRRVLDWIGNLVGQQAALPSAAPIQDTHDAQDREEKSAGLGALLALCFPLIFDLPLTLFVVSALVPLAIYIFPQLEHAIPIAPTVSWSWRILGGLLRPEGWFGLSPGEIWSALLLAFISYFASATAFAENLNSGHALDIVFAPSLALIVFGAALALLFGIFWFLPAAVSIVITVIAMPFALLALARYAG